MSDHRLLEGITVVEISSSVAAPFAARIFADLGADVIKIEAPGGGDSARKWGPPFWRDDATPFHAFNRGKRSITVDLKDPAQIAMLSDFIAERADIVLQNLRAGLVERYGLDAQTLRARAPGLIYANIGAFGEKGPMRMQPGYEALMQAISGLISLTGEADRDPVRIGAPIADMGTGMWTVIGCLAALHERQRSGEGRVVGTSLYDTSLGWTAMAMAQYQATGKVPSRTGLKGISVVPNGGFHTADGLLVITVGTDVQFRSLCGAVGRAELADDPRFVTNADRRANETALLAILGDIFPTRTRAEWCEILGAAGVAAIPVQNLAEAAESEQTAASEMLQDCPGDELKLIGLPLRFDGERPKPRWPAPKQGEPIHQLKSDAAE
ncbi:CoA transferase [Aquabacter sp. CN5-332]|uniref:CaiB/BaiF CoA transferase family protein n=1 Tax=Aquabacter sp. CN5-332 TaxID=3156608 RepID=UPI0032B40A25